MGCGKKRIVPKLLFTTLMGAVLGFILGLLAQRYSWGFGYPTAIGMVIGSAFGAETIASVSAAFLSEKFEKYSRSRKLLLQMAASLLSHILGWMLIIWLAGNIVGFNPFRWEVLIWLVIFIAIIFISSVIRQLTASHRELKEKDRNEERLRTLAAQAELKALKAQINPHFLFNSLNTIASLIQTAPPKAEEAVEKLADVFRYTLFSSEKEFVPLRNELDFLDAYFDVEKARFGNRLNVIKSIPQDVFETSIPSLIIQPLVENCIKYGVDDEGNVKIEIRCFTEGDKVTIEVRDEGRGAPDDVKQGDFSRGNGLRNVNERLLQLYGNEYGLKIRDNIPIGTIAAVSIPKE